MKAQNIENYVKAGCIIIGETPSKNVIARHLIYKGKLCDECFAFNNGTCESYQKLTEEENEKKRFAQPSMLTVRQEATKRNMSIKQVRKERSQMEINK
jgi:hypothetical protein